MQLFGSYVQHRSLTYTYIQIYLTPKIVRMNLRHITLLLRDLHWLRVPQQIKFKLTVLVFRCLHGIAPPYLTCKLHHVADMDCRCWLCSPSTLELHVLPMRYCWRPCFRRLCNSCLEQSAIWRHHIAIADRLQMTAKDSTLQPLVWSLIVWFQFLTCLALSLVLFFSAKCSWTFFGLYSTIIILVYNTHT